jgi:hypothetical protein
MYLRLFLLLPRRSSSESSFSRPLLALSGGSQGGEFTSAFGRAAEVHGRTASAASEAYDPEPTLAGSKYCAAASPALTFTNPLC